MRNHSIADNPDRAVHSGQAISAMSVHWSAIGLKGSYVVYSQLHLLINRDFFPS